MTVPALDPYAVLRIGRDATIDDINAAFKRRAKETHPDTGGDEAEFLRVKSAHLLLSDAERRKRFDETGDATEATPPPNPDAQAFQQIDQFIAAAIGGDNDPFQEDLVSVIAGCLSQKAKAISEELATLRRSQMRAEKMRNRFKRVTVGDNILDAQVRWHIQQIGMVIAKHTETLAHVQRAIVIVREYRFERDLPVYQHAPADGWNNSTAAGSGGFFSLSGFSGL